MVKSPLRYPGGKSRAVKLLSQFLPFFKEFREPMCGGASMTLYLAQVYPQARYVMGDINYDLYCFWKTLKERPKELVNELRRIKVNEKNGRKLFERLMQKAMQRPPHEDCFEKAVRFFVLNRISFSGTVYCGGYSEEAFRKRFTDSSVDRLMAVGKVLEKVEVVYGDYEELLMADGEDVVVFLDPPYYSARGSRLYGKRGNLHVDFDHERLARLVKECKHKVIITYDDNFYIRALYEGFRMVEWGLKYGMTSWGRDCLREGSELLIMNY